MFTMRADKSDIPPKPKTHDTASTGCRWNMRHLQLTALATGMWFVSSRKRPCCA